MAGRTPLELGCGATGGRGLAAGPRVCLTIGSSDSSGGAGIQGDIKALASVSCYAVTVLVGVTAQNTGGIVARHTVPVRFVLEQLRTVLDDVRVDAVKIGMTWSVDHVVAIADAVGSLGVPIVVDPVMVTAAGSSLSGPEIRETVIDRLLPLADVITPNVSEARMLTGEDRAHPARLVSGLIELGARAAVVTTGGSADADWFADREGEVRIVRGCFRTGAEHGAGCAHSAVVAGLLAAGVPVRQAVSIAAELAARGVRDGLSGVGRHVHPVDLLGLSGRSPADA
jgi:hydroxymethylpyrimidine/phosphomethylpyrimidine kinase